MCVIKILVNWNFWFAQNITFKNISLNLNCTTELIFVKQNCSDVYVSVIMCQRMLEIL